MIMLAIAALVVATPLTMVSQATSDSSIGLGLGDGETTWAEASETGGTIDSILLAETDIAVTGVTLDKNTITLATGETYAFTATVSPSDATNKSIKWSSSNKAVATVDENGVVTAVGTGQITLSATTADGNFRAFCTVKVTTFTAHTTGVYLDKSTMTLPIYGTGQIAATVSPSDAANKNVTWSSSNRMVANVDATGKVTGITQGTATITVTTVDGGHTATCTVTVASPVKGVTLDHTAMTINLYEIGKLTATVSPTNTTNKNVTWSSSNGMVVNVDATGKLTGITTGTAIITVTTVDGGYTATCIVNVVIPVTGVFIDPPLEITLNGGETWQVPITVSPNNATDKSVKWSSSNDLVATVDSNGLVTAVGGGTATITVTTSSGGFKAACYVTVLVLVDVPATGVEIDKSTMTLISGNTGQLTATVIPADATDKSITWFSNEESVAIVDSDGLVTAVGGGTAGIFVKTNDGNFMDVCIVTVVPSVPVTDVGIDEAVMILIIGNTGQLTATVSPSSATNKSITWSSSDESVATVIDGLVTADGVGTATITVTTVDGGYTATCVVTVVIPVTGVILNFSSIDLYIGGTLPLTATVSPASATDKSITWISDNTAVATVDGITGLLTAVGTGTATITVTTVNGGYSDICTVTVI